VTAEAGRSPESCGRCGSGDLTRFAMVLTDGTDVTFIACQACEAREWLHQHDDGTWESLPIALVLERSTKKQQ